MGRSTTTMLLAAATLAARCGGDAIPATSSAPVPLQVHFLLTDPDHKPVGQVPVRLVFGSDPDWASPTAGVRLVTDGAGQARVETAVVIDKQLKKAPTNFVASLLSRPQATDHLRIGAELPYMEYQWLYAIDIFRFPEGDVLLDRVAIYSADADGRFTREAETVGQDWKIADLGGLLLTNPGHQPQDYFLAPALPGPGWTLKLAFTRYPPPIRR